MAVIEELVAKFRIDSSGAKKDADAAKASIANVKKSATTSEADLERIERSREQSREKRRKERERKEKQEQKDTVHRAEETSSAVESLGRGVVSAFLGFEGIKSAINFFGQLNTTVAALGRNARNFGVDSKTLQGVANAVELIHGDPAAAKAGFAAVAQQITAFKTRGEVGPLLQLSSNAGVFARDEAGQFKTADKLLPELIDGLRKQGFKQPDIANLLQGAGVSEDLVNLYTDPNRDRLLKEGRAAAFTNDKIEGDAQKLQEIIAKTKQGIKLAVVGTGVAISDALDESPKSFFGKVNDTLGQQYKSAIANPATVGVKNNNPGNLRAPGATSGFRDFIDMQSGYAALQRDIDIKIDKDHLDTVRGIISRYAPPDKDGKGDHNQTDAYIADVAKRVGLDPDARITSREQRFNLVEAIARHEQGAKGFAQVQQAMATPGAAGAGAASGAGASHVTNVQIDRVEVNTQATDADGIAGSFFGAMQRKGVLASQTNTGITP